MAFLEIAITEIKPAQYVDPYTGKTLKEITRDELKEFNRDYKAVAAQYASDAVRLSLDKYKFEALNVARAVMYKASQPYGGANSLGQEIVMRMIKPVDVNYGTAPPNEENWDTNLSAEALGNLWGFQTGGTTPAADTMTKQEGNLLVGWTDPVPLCGFASYQVVKAGRTYPWFTITFTPCAADQLPYMECMAPIAEYPEDNIMIQMDVARLANPDRMQAIGVHFCRASDINDITAATGSGGT